MRHGDGKLTLRDGSTLSATWHEGEPRGTGTITYLDGSHISIGLEAVQSLLKAKARDAVQGGGAGETKWQRKQRPRLQRWLDSAVIVVRDCKRAERYATQPFGAGDAEDIALETEVRRASNNSSHTQIDATLQRAVKF